MGPLLNPIALILTFVIFLAYVTLAVLAISLVSLVTGLVYYRLHRKREGKVRISDSVFVGLSVGVLQVIALIALAGPALLISWFISGLLMVL